MPHQEIYEQKKELGTEMLQHCKGLLLTITVLAGVLTKKDIVDEWNMVHTNVYAYIRKGTDLGPDYKGEGYEGVSWLLELSYDDLPYYLKLCFLYLAHFPEDYEIPVSTFTKLWMAEGFISLTSMEVMEDVSYLCLSELVGRCMVQVGKHGSSKKIKTCHLHDLMRDLCMLKAKEENFLHIINYSAAVNIKQTPNSRVRRYLPSKRLRHFVRGEMKIMDMLGLFYILSQHTAAWTQRDFTLLRVLKLGNMSIRAKLPGEIENLVHLRFLSLKNSLIEAVPSSIANLIYAANMRSLCRLHIEHCLDLKALPDGLQHITTLKELTIKEMRSKFCSRLGEGGEDFYKIQHVQSVIITIVFPDEDSENLKGKRVGGEQQEKELALTQNSSKRLPLLIPQSHPNPSNAQ
ncbi:hypothetical protein Prudu_006312 [Prunus dulcis]|uniref:Uncharacterized protein n=1 Tax=Prunus dulcis TaxID=3755 RepID=A0A4Y1QZK8_PRUDU|nr:hypothetical protein Prudu_006312 [Prunus dulcis]